jgi:hypothetical protein
MKGHVDTRVKARPQFTEAQAEAIRRELSMAAAN